MISKGRRVYTLSNFAYLKKIEDRAQLFMSWSDKTLFEDC